MSPSGEKLRHTFTRREGRRQRRTDSTVSVLKKRFEVPSRYRHLDQLTIRYARWDLSRVLLVDPVTGTLLARLYPLDRERNAERGRRSLAPLDQPAAAPRSMAEPGLPPLMRKMLAEYAVTGLPFCYQQKDDQGDSSKSVVTP